MNFMRRTGKVFRRTPFGLQASSLILFFPFERGLLMPFLQGRWVGKCTVTTIPFFYYNRHKNIMCQGLKHIAKGTGILNNTFNFTFTAFTHFCIFKNSNKQKQVSKFLSFSTLTLKHTSAEMLNIHTRSYTSNAF